MKDKPQTMECVIFPYRAQFYLLPLTGIVEVFSLERYQTRINASSFLVGMLPWRNLTVPIITPDLLGYDFVLHHPKAAVIQALGLKADSPQFFAFVFENSPVSVNLSEEQIVWIDATERKAHLRWDTKSQDVILMDLQQLSVVAQKIQRDPNDKVN